MSNDPADTPKQSLSSLLTQLGDEFEAERKSSLKPEEKLLEDIAREALRLERDMTIPGSALPVATRIDRLTRFISEKDF